MTDKDTIELEACPFCGGEVEFVKDHTTDNVDVIAHVGWELLWYGRFSNFREDKSVIDLWNTRAPRQAPQVDVEGLKKNPDDFGTIQYQARGKYTYSLGWNDCLDHFAAKGHLTPKQDEWQPIETAPKDGETIMVWRKNSGGIWWGSFDGHKWLVVYGNNKVAANDITHWMPLPKPPKTGE